MDSSIIAELVALKPASYIGRIIACIGAFYAALNIEGTFSRAAGVAVLVIAGGGLLIVGLSNGTAIDILLGILGSVAAGYTWWHTRI